MVVHPVSRLVRRWRAGGPMLPTTAAGAEWAIVLALSGVRVGVLVLMIPSLPAGVALSERPWLYSSGAVLVLIETVALVAWALRRGRWPGVGPSTADLGLCCALLLLEFAYVPMDHRLGSWVGWPTSLVLTSVAAAATVIRRRWVLLVATVAVMASFLVATSPVPERQTWNLVSSALTFLIWATLARLLSSYMRRMAVAADAARTAAASSARDEQFERTRLLLHDSASVLLLLSEVPVAEPVTGALRRQAGRESVRIRRFLSGEVPPDSGDVDGPVERQSDTVSLIGIVLHVGGQFTDLLVDYLLDLVDGVSVDAPRARAVERALTAVLHNVRLHAEATRVVIHGDVVGDEWELTIQDDGRGFDPAQVHRGFGLEIQVERSLGVHGVRAEVRSGPGEGTAVVMRAPRVGVR